MFKTSSSGRRDCCLNNSNHNNNYSNNYSNDHHSNTPQSTTTTTTTTNMNPDNMSATEVMEIVMGFQKTQVLYTATTLGIFEELTHSISPMSAYVIACRLGLDPDATERLLNACSALSLLEKSYTSNRLAVYKNTPCAEMFLASSGPASMRPLIAKIGDLYALYGQLKKGVKEGKRQLNSALGSGDQCFNKGNGFYCNDEKQIEFLQTMHMFSRADSPSVLRAFDLSPFKTAVDLGGGTGAFGLSLATKYPSMDVTVSDLDHVVNSRHHFLSNDLPQNLKFESKDFFKEPLTPADLYILSHVVHDWNDESLDVLLKKVYEAVNSGGALLVLEKVLNDDKDGPLMTLIFDLGILVAAGGRERTASEYKHLLNGHGFLDVQIRRLSEARFRDAILALKPEVKCRQSIGQ